MANNSAIAASKVALCTVLRPVADFALESGLSFHETQQMLREVWVRDAAAKQKLHTKRINLSGIAAATGISRSEISRILGPKKRVRTTGRQTPAMRVLAAWHERDKYLSSGGRPRDLRIYGKGATFEDLVRKYGLGLPVRAVLDELMRIGALEIINDQFARAKNSVRAITRSAEQVRMFGERAGEILNMLLQQLNAAEGEELFIYNCQKISNADLSQFQLEDSGIFREMTSKLSLFFNRQICKAESSDAIRNSMIGVATILALQYSDKGASNTDNVGIRKNFRRAQKSESSR